MKKPELLLPAGNIDCLRAAVANGADAVYFGLQSFNARISAGNIDESNLSSVISYCHDRGVKAYVALNILVKNNEIMEFLRLAGIAQAADAVIIQDIGLIPRLRKIYPDIVLHLSTQATTTNTLSIPEGVARVILPREMPLDQIRAMSSAIETEAFVHGALCISYSGQCLFSSMVGGRSGNRGRCAQPCRKRYNNSFILSTKDLCLIRRLPELIDAGISAFKVEGRMRSPLYVGTVARVYRKTIDSYKSGSPAVDEHDIHDLMLAFSREFTEGYAFTDSIVDSRASSNRGLFLGKVKDGMVRLHSSLSVGDGIGIWSGNNVSGKIVEEMLVEGSPKDRAEKDEIVDLRLDCRAEFIYKTSSPELMVKMGDELLLSNDVSENVERSAKILLDLPEANSQVNPEANSITNQDPGQVTIIAKAYNKRSAIEADKAGAGIIYYDILAEDFLDVKKSLKRSRLFASTPRILDDLKNHEIADRIMQAKPDGVLAANRGLLPLLDGFEIHLDHSFNIFNDQDIIYYGKTPIISPELNLDEIRSFRNKDFIVLVHGDIVLMTLTERIKAPELIDGENMHFRVRHAHGHAEILNSRQMGLFNKVNLLAAFGIKMFLIDLEKDLGKYTRIYAKVLKKEFDDSKIKKGYTTGHFSRGVS